MPWNFVQSWIAFPFFPYPIWKLQDERKIFNAKPLNHAETYEPVHRTNTRDITDTTIGNNEGCVFLSSPKLMKGENAIKTPFV